MTGVWVAVGFLAVTVLALAVILIRRRPGSDLARELPTLRESTRLLSDQVSQLAQLVTTQLGTLSSQVSDQLASTAQLLQRQEGTLGERLTAVQGVVADVRERLGGLTETGRRLTELAQDLASLQEILRAPKARGAIGEWLLGDLLAEVLPHDRYREQYRFSTGEVVDAAIFLEGTIVPVDAKFPLSGFERLLSAATDEERKKHKRALVRDAQRHADGIAEKYIRPEEGTADFALMYVPAEGVYHELLIPEGDLDFLSYAMGKRVVPCSPNSFYSYLRSVAMGLRGMALARNVQEVFGELRAVEGLMEKMEGEMQTLGTHLRNARGKHEEIEKLVGDIQQRLTKLAAQEGEG